MQNTSLTVCTFVAVMIPDGIREADNEAASPGVEAAAQNETKDTCRAEEEAAMSEEQSGDNEMAESGRQETVEEDSYITQQRGLNSSEVPPTSEVGSDCNVDDRADSGKKDDDVASPDPIADGEMKASLRDADSVNSNDVDRQHGDSVAQQTTADDSRSSEANTLRGDTASETASAETSTCVVAEEDEYRISHGMFKQFLNSDTENHDENMLAQQQSMERMKQNDNEQPTGLASKDTADGKMMEEESETIRAGKDEKALDDNVGRAFMTNEYVVDESSDEENENESICSGTRQVAENDKEPVENEETEQLSENKPGQTSAESVKSVEESAAETAMHAKSHAERDAQTPGTSAEDGETQQQLSAQCMTNEKPDLISYNQDENVEEQLLLDSRTVAHNAAEETEETTAKSIDANSRRSSEGGKSPEPAADVESAEEQILQRTETSIGKDEGLAVNSVQSAESQPNGASELIEQVDEVSTQHTCSCNQSVQDNATDANECIIEQSHNSTGEDVKTEHNAASTKNTEENVENTDMDGKAPRVTENGDSNQSQTAQENENGQGQGTAVDKENNAAEESTASGANTKEVHEDTDIIKEKHGDESCNKFDESAEETNANYSLYAGEIRSSSAENTVEQSDKNVMHEGEVDRNIQTGSKESSATSDTTRYEAHGVDDGSAQKVSNSAEEAQEHVAESNEEMQGQASETYETSETEIVTKQNNATESLSDNSASEKVDEEPLMVNRLTEKLTGEEITTTVENVDINEQQNKQETEQVEPETEFQPIVTNNSEVDEAVTTTKELAMHISEEVSVGVDQPCESSVDLSRERPEELENGLKSENVVDESSAVNNDIREIIEGAVENSTAETEGAQQREIAVESQAQQSTSCETETGLEQPERNEVPVEDKSHPDKQTTENCQENENYEPCVENPNKHHEIESAPGTSDVVKEQTVDVDETAEDRASSAAVEPSDKSTVEVNHECVVQLETETDRPIETVAAEEKSVSESAKQVINDSFASDTPDVQSTEIPETAGDGRLSEAGFDQQNTDEIGSPVTDSIEPTKEQHEIMLDGEQVGLTQSALDNVASDVAENPDNSVTSEHNLYDDKDAQYRSNDADEVTETYSVAAENGDHDIAEQNEITDTDPVPSQTKTSPSVQVVASCSGTAESSTFASCDVFEVRRTDKVPQQDSGILVCGESEEMSNHHVPSEKDDPEPMQLFNGNDDTLDPVEKHESIRTYIDGYRDIELSGMKLDTDQVGLNTDRLFRSLIFQL